MRNFLFCAIVCAMPAIAAAASPSSRSITLDVRNAPSSGSDGYADTTASNGKTYSYKYSGGDNGGGDVTFTGRGAGTVVVHLRGSRYAIDTVDFPDDPNDQLSDDPSASSPTSAVIKDKNDTAQTATYKVTVKDSSANATVPCDPKIINN